MVKLADMDNSPMTKDSSYEEDSQYSENRLEQQGQQTNGMKITNKFIWERNPLISIKIQKELFKKNSINFYTFGKSFQQNHNEKNVGNGIGSSKMGLTNNGSRNRSRSRNQNRHGSSKGFDDYMIKSCDNVTNVGDNQQDAGQ